MIKIKIAVIADIHGNSVALKEILKDTRKEGVDEYVFLGDLINDFPFGNETLEIVKSISKDVLKGNKEQYLIEYDDAKYEWPNIQFKNTKYMYNELSKENLEYIKNLPMNMYKEYDGVKILFAHGAPESVEVQIHPEDVDLIDKYTKDLDADALIFGHTHDKMWKEVVNNKLIVNAGCAGVSPYYIGGAEYVVLSIENGKLDVEFKVVKYDVDALKNKIRECGILEHDTVLMNLTVLGIDGHGKERYSFFKEAKTRMLERNGKWYQDDAKGIFKYFKLFDDDIWLDVAAKFKDIFSF